MFKDDNMGPNAHSLDIPPTPRQLLLQTHQIVLAHGHNLHRVGELEVGGVGVGVGGEDAFR